MSRLARGIRRKDLRTALTVAPVIRLPGDYLPWGLGDKPDGSLWTTCPATVSHTFFPLYVPSWPHWAGQLCWTAGCG